MSDKIKIISIKWNDVENFTQSSIIPYFSWKLRNHLIPHFIPIWITWYATNNKWINDCWNNTYCDSFKVVNICMLSSFSFTSNIVYIFLLGFQAFFYILESYLRILSLLGVLHLLLQFYFPLYDLRERSPRSCITVENVQ